jgi:hypothetical protein
MVEEDQAWTCKMMCADVLRKCTKIAHSPRYATSKLRRVLLYPSLLHSTTGCSQFRNVINELSDQRLQMRVSTDDRRSYESTHLHVFGSFPTSFQNLLMIRFADFQDAVEVAMSIFHQ